MYFLAIPDPVAHLRQGKLCTLDIHEEHEAAPLDPVDDCMADDPEAAELTTQESFSDSLGQVVQPDHCRGHALTKPNLQ